MIKLKQIFSKLKILLEIIVFKAYCLSYYFSVKPDPPLHLQVEMTDTGQLKISWSQPASKSNLFLYEVKCFTNSTKSFQQVRQISYSKPLIK